MRLFALAPLFLLAACGGSEEESAAVEAQSDTPEVEAIEPRDITAIDAATDNDAGLADDEVPGRDAGEDAR